MLLWKKAYLFHMKMFTLTHCLLHQVLFSKTWSVARKTQTNSYSSFVWINNAIIVTSSLIWQPNWFIIILVLTQKNVYRLWNGKIQPKLPICQFIKMYIQTRAHTVERIDYTNWKNTILNLILLANYQGFYKLLNSTFNKQ